MSLFDKFQAEVGRDQGAKRLFVTSDGYFNVGDVQGGADGADITGAALKYALLSPMTRTSFTMASAIQTVSVIPATYGLVNVYYPSATTSVKVPAANVGATLWIIPSPVASTISLLAGTSGSIAVGYSDISCILFSMNGTSGAWIQLVCSKANEWQVAVADEQGNTVSVQRST